MAVKNPGISTDLLIHPGETIFDLLEERGMSQKELALRTGVSEAFLSDVINGKKNVSSGLAAGLEYAFGVPSSFWLNLQANYDAELLALKEEESIDEEETSVLKKIHDIATYLIKESYIKDGLTQVQIIIELRRFFHVRRLTGLKMLVPMGAFRMSEKATVDSDVLGAWLCICKNRASEKKMDSDFKPENVDDLITGIKKVMLDSSCDLQKNLMVLFAGYGIDFSIVKNFRGAPVHGYIARKEDETYQMVLTLRGAFADIFWFSLFHELGHIVNGDVPRVGSYIDAQYSKDEKRELNADLFASRALLDQASYERFLDGRDFSYSCIRDYARTQYVPPYVVIGRLQKEGIIPWTRYQRYKPRYKWAES